MTWGVEQTLSQKGVSRPGTECAFLVAVPPATVRQSGGAHPDTQLRDSPKEKSMFSRIFTAISILAPLLIICSSLGIVLFEHFTR